MTEFLCWTCLLICLVWMQAITPQSQVSSPRRSSYRGWNRPPWQPQPWSQAGLGALPWLRQQAQNAAPSWNWAAAAAAPRSTFSTAGRWPNGVIIYQVDPSLASFRPIIGRAMREIEARTCIRFRERQNEPDYVYLVNGKGCHSKVGRTGGRQVLSLGAGCHDVGSTLHELCHAVGLYHEHMRYDRDQFLQIDWNNILPNMYDQFQKIPVFQYRPASNFDYNSIMIYGAKAFTRNGQRTMIPRDPQARILESHFKQNLAQSDILNINSLYGC